MALSPYKKSGSKNRSPIKSPYHSSFRHSYRSRSPIKSPYKSPYKSPSYSRFGSGFKSPTEQSRLIYKSPSQMTTTFVSQGSRRSPIAQKINIQKYSCQNEIKEMSEISKSPSPLPKKLFKTEPIQSPTPTQRPTPTEDTPLKPTKIESTQEPVKEAQFESLQASDAIKNESNATFGNPNMFKKCNLGSKTRNKQHTSALCFKKKSTTNSLSGSQSQQNSRGKQFEVKRVKTFNTREVHQVEDQILNIKPVLNKINQVIAISNTKGDYPLKLNLKNTRTGKITLRRKFSGSKFLFFIVSSILTVLRI